MNVPVLVAVSPAVVTVILPVLTPSGTVAVICVDASTLKSGDCVLGTGSSGRGNNQLLSLLAGVEQQTYDCQQSGGCLRTKPRSFLLSVLLLLAKNAAGQSVYQVIAVWHRHWAKLHTVHVDGATSFNVQFLFTNRVITREMDNPGLVNLKCNGG